MTEEVDCIVAGAGVVGLAVARELARRGLEVLILEADTMIGTGISSRNSEVIHAGIYYPPGSLKAQACVEGRDLLYRYLADHGVPHRRCGKLIVATSPHQNRRLAAIAANAHASGVHDLREISAAEAMSMEPGLHCTAALLSPSTGIVDSHGLMLALLGDAEAAGAAIGYNAEIVGGRVEAGRTILETRDRTSGDGFEIATQRFVNAAGLGANAIATIIEGFPTTAVPPLYYAKGNYFSVTGLTPFTRLIYPVPEPGGLGVHLTLDLNGVARFGPDVEWTDRLDYQVDPRRADSFYAAIRSYWPALRDGTLEPAYSGIRPKLTAPGAAAADFVVQGPADHGVAGLVNLFGIESPGLTSCLAIAARAVEALER